MKRKPRINNQIRVSPVRLIDEKGQNLGVVEIFQALKLSREKGLDLVEIAPIARPPVCRIVDYGKYQYQRTRLEKQQKVKQKTTGMKGVRISLRVGRNDLETKVRQAEKFLKAGHKVRIEVILRGREKSYQFQNLAKEKLQEFIQLISVETITERDLRREGRGLNMIVKNPI